MCKICNFFYFALIGAIALIFRFVEYRAQVEILLSKSFGVFGKSQNWFNFDISSEPKIKQFQSKCIYIYLCV